MLVEVHEGIYDNHSGGKVLAGKVMRAGYYWPRALQDIEVYVRKCRKCHEYSKVPHCPPEELTSITSPWPFAQWGIDIVGPLPLGKGRVRFVVVEVDYFIK